MSTRKRTMEKAKELLIEYVEEYQKEEVAVEAPVWFGELQQCKTVCEITRYMDDFSPKCELCGKPVNVIEKDEWEPDTIHYGCIYLESSLDTDDLLLLFGDDQKYTLINDYDRITRFFPNLRTSKPT